MSFLSYFIVSMICVLGIAWCFFVAVKTFKDGRYFICGMLTADSIWFAIVMVVVTIKYVM